MAIAQAVDILGRVLLVSYFLKAGVQNAQHPSRITQLLQFKKIPLASVVTMGVLAVQLLGGLAVIFNYHAAMGAVALIIFTILSNVIFCSYWKMEGADRRNINFLFYANIAVIGGLLLIVGANS